MSIWFLLVTYVRIFLRPYVSGITSNVAYLNEKVDAIASRGDTDLSAMGDKGKLDSFSSRPMADDFMSRLAWQSGGPQKIRQPNK